MSFKTAVVIGAGAFGTSIASILATNFEKVILKVRSQDVYDSLLKRENAVYLPNQKLPKNLEPALSWDEVDSKVVGKVELLVSGLPSSAIKSFCEENYDPLLKYFSSGIPLVSLSKGIDPVTLELGDDLFNHKFLEFREQMAFLSGPSFAMEIVEKQVTVVSLAGRCPKVLNTLSDMFQTPYFKVFLSYDVKGVLLGGALKNVLAIAGGIIEGLGYNHNTRAAMITRGIYEMLRFGVVFNARPETFYGLSGMGDLILTTTGGLSRNKKFGLDIAQGRSPDEILSSQRTVVEGYKTAAAVYNLSKKYHIMCRIFNGVHSVLYEHASPSEVISQLMAGDARFEI